MVQVPDKAVALINTTGIYSLCARSISPHPGPFPHSVMCGELRVEPDTGTIGCGCSASSTSPIQYSPALVSRYHSIVFFSPSSQDVRSVQPRLPSLSLPM